MVSGTEYRTGDAAHVVCTIASDVKHEPTGLGEALALERHKRGITQGELSNMTGVTQADISRIERGTRNPSVSVVMRLLDGLGLSLGFVEAQDQR